MENTASSSTPGPSSKPTSRTGSGLDTHELDEFAIYNCRNESSMDCLDRSLPIIDDDDHGLLDAPLPAYTDLTVRRAFATWLHCGHKAKFRLICDYYHRLEAMERKLSPNQRAQSRYHEFNLLINGPPRSFYQMMTFPDLYSQSHIQSDRIFNLQAITNEKCIFKLEGFHEIAGTSKETHSTCRIVQKYCKTKALSLRAFLYEFQNYITKCNLESNVCNLTNYINKKMVESEIQIMNNYPKSFSFLEHEEELNNSKHEAKTETSKAEIVTENVNKLNKSTAEFFETFSNKEKTVCWMFDTKNHIINNDKINFILAGNQRYNAEMMKNIDNWSLLKSLLNNTGTAKLPSYEKYKI